MCSSDLPRQIVTTTPRPVPLVKRLLADPMAVVTRAATRANALNLAPAFLDTIVSRYAGTRLGRQEIDGEMIEDRPDALWTRATIEGARIAVAPISDRAAFFVHAAPRRAARAQRASRQALRRTAAWCSCR